VEYTLNESMQFSPVSTPEATTNQETNKELHVQTATELQESFKDLNPEAATSQVTESLAPLNEDAKKKFEEQLDEVVLEENDKQYKRSTDANAFEESTDASTPGQTTDQGTDP
jgi:ABC-type glutathione transport system ATPase component